MNGFYTCLLGNVVTAFAMTLPLWAGAMVMTMLALVCVWAERSHIERYIRRRNRKAYVSSQRSTVYRRVRR